MTTASYTPTIVLVHGGFADAWYWAPVIAELQSRGLPVVAPANPLRGLAGDAEYVASFVNQIDGPVLLVERERAALERTARADRDEPILHGIGR